MGGPPIHPTTAANRAENQVKARGEEEKKRARAVVHQKERLLLFLPKTAFFTWAPRVSCKVLCTRLRGQLRVSPIPGVVVFRCALLQFLILLGSYIAVVISWILYIFSIELCMKVRLHRRHPPVTFTKWSNSVGCLCWPDPAVLSTSSLPKVRLFL